MKKIIAAAAFIIAALLIFNLFIDMKTEEVDNKAEDYKKIDTAISEMERVSKTSMSSYSNLAQWYIYDMRLMYQKNSGIFIKIRKDLGEDFDSVLSNGDPIFIGILPMNRKYRVYAGKPDNDHMIYPDWNYQALEKP